MYLRTDLLLESGVDEALAIDEASTFEPLGNDDGAEVPEAASRAGVTDVEVALVDNLEVNRLELIAQRRLDPPATIRSLRHALHLARAAGGGFESDALTRS